MSPASILCLMAALAALPRFLAAQSAPAPWFVAEMRQLVTQPGVWWVTSNTAYQAPIEPFVQYAIRWSAEDDGRTLSGRLVAVDTAGKVHPMWTYRMYWHPGERQGYLAQTSSWGAYGIGPLQLDPTAKTLVNVQDFWQPDGTASRSRHRSWFSTDDEHVTVTHNWQGGAWAPGRTYRWIRQPFADSAARSMP